MATDGTIRIYCDRQPEHAAAGSVEIHTFHRRGQDWIAGKRTDEHGRRIRSRSVTALEGDSTVDRRFGPAIQWLATQGMPTGALRERIELECPVCGERAEVRGDNDRFVRILDQCAASTHQDLPLSVLKIALGRNV